jgi:hypothetical protein
MSTPFGAIAFPSNLDRVSRATFVHDLASGDHFALDKFHPVRGGDPGIHPVDAPIIEQRHQVEGTDPGPELNRIPEDVLVRRGEFSDQCRGREMRNGAHDDLQGLCRNFWRRLHGRSRQEWLAKPVYR